MVYGLPRILSGESGLRLESPVWVRVTKDADGLLR